MVFWEVEEHEVAHSELRAFKMRPGNGVLGSRRARSGLQLAPGIQNVAREWRSGKSKSTKWPTVGSGHSECGLGMAFWEVEEHEVCDCLLKTSFPGSPRMLADISPTSAQTPLCSHLLLSFEPTRNLSVFAVR